MANTSRSIIFRTKPTVSQPPASYQPSRALRAAVQPPPIDKRHQKLSLVLFHLAQEIPTLQKYCCETIAYLDCLVSDEFTNTLDKTLKNIAKIDHRRSTVWVMEMTFSTSMEVAVAESSFRLDTGQTLNWPPLQ